MLLLIIQLSGARVLEEYQASEVRPSETFQDLGKTLPRNEKSVKNSTSTFIEAGGEETRQTIESEEENRAPTVLETTTEASTTTKIIDHNKVTDSNLLGFLIAESDPALIRILIDNSKPENLDVFLTDSSLTLRDLEDIIDV